MGAKMPIQRICIIGADGMLGRAVTIEAARRGLDCVPLILGEIDLRDQASVDRLNKVSFDALINCAAYTDVDGAEEHEALATEINGEGVARLAAVCERAGVPIVHISTDYVFNGSATAPYPIGAPIEPVNAYGRSKEAGEHALGDSKADWLCCRTSWLYAGWGKNFVLTMVKLLSERDELRVVDDQRGRPTSALQLAERSLGLLLAGHRGMAHVTDADECTWYGLTRAIRDLTGSTASVAPCTSDEFPRPAKRPAYSVLDIAETERVLGPARSWRDELERVLACAGRVQRPGHGPANKPAEEHA